MLAVEDKTKQAFSLVFVDGALRIACSQTASASTMLLMSRCVQLMTTQIVGRVDRAGGTQASSVRPDAIAPIESPGTARPSPATQSAEPPSADALPVAAPMAAAQPASPASAVLQPIPLASAALETTDPVYLSDAIDQWWKSGVCKFSENTWLYSYGPSFRVWRELISVDRRDRQLDDGSLRRAMLDIPVRSIGRQHVCAFHAGLKKLPGRQGQRDDGMEATQRIAIGIAQKRKPMSADSVQQKLEHIKPFLDYAHLKGWIPLEVISEMKLSLLAASVEATKVGSTSKKHGYVALNESELKLMFESHDFLAGAVKADWCYWVPLLCLHQGMRVSEASQLFTDDVRTIDGVPSLSVITDETEDEEEVTGKAAAKQKKLPNTVGEYRRLKNQASRRTLPIHPRLLELGFLDFVNSVRSISDKPEHLFYGLRWEQKSMFGRKPSEFMRDLIYKAGFWVRRKKVPHSLRSNFNQAIAKTNLPDNLQKRMLGHGTKSIKDEHYSETDEGPAFPVQLALPELAKVAFNLTLLPWSEIVSRRRGSLPRRAV